MRAGRMREHISFTELQRIQSPSGAIKEQWVTILSCRAELMKTLPVYDKDGVQAKEVFQGVTRIFKVRRNPRIKDTMRLIHDNREYDIIHTFPNIDDNSITVHVRRRNE